MKIDAITRAWLRNPSDERAAANGCRFDVERAAFRVWWIEHFCRLYEGEQAGERLVLHGCHKCGAYGLPECETWEEARPHAIERAKRFAKCVKLRHPLDWQYECTMRLFGWVKASAKWKRDVRRFRAATIFVPKKNKKSPTLAAWALFLLAGDGEPGQKVFLCAKDGSQAREIAGKHAMEMVAASDQLSAECTTNKNLMQITHEASRSTLRPLSSGNTNNQKAKEGLNGSCLIDETHVVDRAFVAIISRAGISRSEPLQIEVSTAGSDPEGYGHERFELAERVLKGDYRDNDQEHVFAAIYAAPQDLSDAELARDPLKWGRIANPAMGHTVDAEEYLADYNASKGSLQQLALFKMYRLNIWQRAATPWLDMIAWDRCKAPFTEQGLIGMPCACALDLAKTRDTCAEALIFWDAETEKYRQIVRYWLPEKRADALRDKVAYQQWARAGWIVLIPGDTIEYRAIRLQLIADKEKFSIGKLTYDDHYAAQLIQTLIDEDRAFMLDEVCSFPQTVSTFAGPTDEYEAAILAGTLLHNGNPVLDWQAGNAKVKVDANHNKRPVKQQHGDPKTIDGIVAGVMCLAQMESVKRGSVYDTRGIEGI